MYRRFDCLLEALRSRFDAIIIDTGPVITSIEACLVSGLSDRVIMVVNRNQRLASIRSSLARLKSVEATCAGMVFNRADKADFRAREESAATGRTPIAPLVPTVPAGQEEDASPFAMAINKQTAERAASGEERKKAA